MSVEATIALAGTGLTPAQRQVAGAIKQAANSTGASFGYLVATAKIESDMQPRAGASTSSARGLYQFIDQTWLGTVKEAGASLGYGRYANAITRQRSGAHTVSDPAMRNEILKLRDDPAASAAMAGVLTNSNGFKLVGAVGRRVSDNELYMAHFLGVGGASRLLKAHDSNPQASAVSMFPRAAAANHSIFYDKAGNPRTVSQVYSEITRRYDNAANSKLARNAIASVDGAATAPAVASAAAAGGGAYLAAFPQVAAVQTASVAESPSMVTVNLPSIDVVPPARAVASASTDSKPMFRTLFQAGERAEPISPAVRDLWANGTAQAAASPTLKSPTSLDLFSDRYGTFSG